MVGSGRNTPVRRRSGYIAFMPQRQLLPLQHNAIPARAAAETCQGFSRPGTGLRLCGIAELPFLTLGEKLFWLPAFSALK